MQKTKQTIVFLPGMLNTEQLWHAQEQSFKNDFNIFHADIYNNYSLEGMAETILNQTSGKLILVGLSMGGYCALEVLRMKSARVEKIALFNTGARGSTSEQQESRRRLIDQSANGRFVGVGNRMLDILLGKTNRDNQNLRKILVDMAISSGREIYVRQQTAIINRRDCRLMLKGKTLPMLCVAGSEDTVTPPYALQEIASLVKGAEYHEIPNCGHLSVLEFPKKTLQS